jgi:hypothetical protein
MSTVCFSTSSSPTCVDTDQYGAASQSRGTTASFESHADSTLAHDESLTGMAPGQLQQAIAHLPQFENATPQDAAKGLGISVAAVVKLRDLSQRLDAFAGASLDRLSAGLGVSTCTAYELRQAFENGPAPAPPALPSDTGRVLRK